MHRDTATLALFWVWSFFFFHDSLSNSILLLNQVKLIHDFSAAAYLLLLLLIWRFVDVFLFFTSFPTKFRNLDSESGIFDQPIERMIGCFGGLQQQPIDTLLLDL